MKKHPLCTKKKVKSGCLTCKSRRVKCDEGRPACKRCVATGRTCEGYGVWGGGGDIYIRPAIHGVKDWNFPIPIGAVSKDERAGFEWFAQRLNRKLSGLFGSTFWDSLIFQACSKEPAVLHAVLALGGAHRSKVLSGDCPANRESDLDSHERFTLRQYNKSISYLQPHFSENSRESVRVALVTCMVFMCLEFVRGQHKRGNAHLQSGLKLLSKAKDTFSPAEPRVVIQKHHHQSIDEHLTEDFMRIYVQSAFLGHFPQNRYIVVQEPEFQAIPSIFQSIKQARQHLDRLRNDIYCLTQQCRQTENAESLLELIHKQQRIQADLSQWLRSYQVSQTILVDQVDIRGVLAYGLMRIYQTLARVMVATCFSTADESAYDLYTRDFVSIIDQCIDLWKNASPLVASAISAGRHSPAYNFLADMGLIPLLYYTALKCRVTRIRHHAIRLLSLVPFQEGAWNGTMAARIARKAVEIEKGSFYNTKFMADNFPLLHPLQEEDIVSSALPWLPETYRIFRVEIQLPDYATKKVAFFCTRRLPDGNYEVLERECDFT